jgi:CheY-like chemotaxis protein
MGVFIFLYYHEYMSDQKTILVVEDNEPTRALLRGILESEGYRVIETESGEVAVSLAQDEHPDAAIIDQYMEPYNGYKTADFLRHHNVNIPMFLITAHDASDLFSKTQKHGFSNIMKKPLDPKRLLWLLARELR